ncbi:unnamed protein product [Timema podura]|uniref:Uncharacterized protein n=1 Tax=Timema podura TaxID=61482 RepID=A0ABN7NSR3_TIMPD|nr:unnamed protein product [Timema podura]
MIRDDPYIAFPTHEDLDRIQLRSMNLQADAKLLLDKELFRAAGNYMISHKHVEVGNIQAYNVLPTAYTSWEDTLPLGVKAPGIQLPQKVILLQPGDSPNHEPYVPAYKLFFPKGPAETPVNKQFSLTVTSRRTFELENRKPYISLKLALAMERDGRPVIVFVCALNL